MPINYDEIDSNEESIKNLYNPNHPDGQAYLNSAKAKLDNHLKLIEQDPYHKVHAHPSNLANTISHYYGIVERQKNFKSNKGNLTPEHLLNIDKLALNHADHHINRIRAQTIRTEGTVSKVKNIRNTFNKIVKEARMPFSPGGGSWKRSYHVTAGDGGDPDRVHHFQDVNDRATHLGNHPITRALASPMTVLQQHSKGLHQLAQHYESNIRDAERYLNGDSYVANKFKHRAHAENSMKKWQKHLHAYHNDIMRGILADQAMGTPIPKTFEGLTDQHVAEHAKLHGLDVSQPFNHDEFKNKVGSLSIYKIHHGNYATGHPLHKGWITPPESPKKQSGVPQPPPQVESFIMNKSQRIRNIFESKLKEAADLRLVHIGAMGSEALARGEHPRDVAAGIKDAVRRYREGKGKAKGMALAGIHGNAPATPEPTVVGSAQKLAGLAKREKPVEGEKAWQGPKGEGDPIPWGKKARQDTSTNHARAGLKSLFEALLNELKNRREFGDLSPVPRKETRPPVPPDELKIHAADIASHIEGGATGREAVDAEMPQIKSSENWHKMMGAGSQKMTGEQLKDQRSYELALHRHADELASHPNEQNPFHDHGHHIRLGAELGYGPTQVKKHLINTMTKLYNHHVIGMQRGEVPTTPRSQAYAARMINMRNKLSGGPKLRTP